MLEEVDPEGVIKAVSLLASAGKHLDIINQQALMDRVAFLQADVSDFGHVLWALGLLRASAENLQMVGVVRNIDRTAGWTAEVVQIHQNVPQPTLSQLATALASVVSAFGDEMEGRKVFIMQPQYARFYAPDGPLIGETIAGAFPDSADDFDEAGKCLALGLPTACVFHLMRAAESAAAIILKRLGGDPEDEHGEIKPFGSLTQAIDGEIDKMQRGPKKDAWMKLKSFMAAINRGTRTKVAHPGTDYSASKAEGLIALTKGFMQEAEELLRPGAARCLAET